MASTYCQAEACRKPIMFVVSRATGKRMPVDVAPSRNGNIWLDMSGTLPAAEVLAGDKLEAARHAGTPLYVSHFVTCEKAESFRQESMEFSE